MRNYLEKTVHVEIFGEPWVILLYVDKGLLKGYSVHLCKGVQDYPPHIAFYRNNHGLRSRLEFNRDYYRHRTEIGLSPREAKRIILRVLTNDPEEANKNFRR